MIFDRSRLAKNAGVFAAACTLMIFSAQHVQALELRGFPLKLKARVYGASPVVMDLDDDGHQDIALCTEQDLIVLDNSGAPLPGFPFHLQDGNEESAARVAATPSFCRLGSDKTRALVVADAEQSLHAVDATGQELAGWPVKLDSYGVSTPACVDLNGDGQNEVLIVTAKGKILAFASDGQAYKAFRPPHFKAASQIIGQVWLGEKHQDVHLLVGANDGRLHVLNRKGREHKGFPVRSSFAVSAAPAAGDLDEDGRWDFVYASQDFSLYAVDQQGQSLKGFPVKTGYRLYGGVALGDVDADGHLDIVIGGADGLVYAVNAQGKALKGWPVKTKGRIYSSPALADLNRDGTLEVVVNSSDGKMYVFNARGRRFPGYPVRVGGELRGSPQIADLDGNGSLEILVASVSGKLHAYTFVPSNKRPIAKIAWSGLGHGAEHLGRSNPNPGRFKDLQFEPQQPGTADAVKLAYNFYDLDAEAEGKTRIRWFLNGRVQADMSDQKSLPPEKTRKGQRWFFTLQQSSDYALYKTGAGARITRSPKLRIANTPPTAPLIAFAAKTVRTADELRLKMTRPAKDLDDDKLHYKIRWIVDHAVVKALNGAYHVPAKRLKKNALWEVVVTPSDGQSQGPAARLQIRVSNTAPRAAQVALVPQNPKVTDQVSVRIVKPASDADGDSLQYRYTWFVDGKAQPFSPELSTVPASIARKGQKISVAVLAFDGVEDGAIGRAETVIRNTPPPAPKLSLRPAQAKSGDDISVLIQSPKADADGDAIHYKVMWVRNTLLINDATGTSLAANETRRGQKIRAVVVANDGEQNGPKVFAELQVINTAPQKAQIRVLPAHPRAGQILQAELVREAKDIDGDKLSYHWSWRRNGKLQSDLNSNKVPAGRVKKGELWQAQIVADDGRQKGAPAYYDLRIGDTVPEAPQVEIKPHKPQTRDALSVRFVKQAKDLDGDKISYRYRWLLNGLAQDFSAQQDSIAAKLTQRGQLWQVQVWAVADKGKSLVAQAQTRIVNTAPELPKVQILPVKARTGERLVALVSTLPHDDDGDALQLHYRWFKNAQPTNIESAYVPAGHTRRGERWAVVVQADDGKLKSAEARAELQIVNTAPAAALLSVAKTQWRSDEDIHVGIKQQAQDLDADALALRWRWQRDGRALPQLDDKQDLPHTMTAKGQKWSLHVIAYETGEAADKLESPPAKLTLHIINTAPGAPVFALVPKQPDSSQDLQVKIIKDAADIDGDKLRYHMRWYRDGVLQNLDQNSARLVAKKTTHGERWRVDLRAFDGEAEGPMVTASLQIKNTLPALAQLQIKPQKAKTGQALSCVLTKAAKDIDADKLSYVYAWKRNGQPVSFGRDGHIVAGQVKKGQRWICLARAKDAQGFGPQASSKEIAIGNRPPTPPKVLVWPAKPSGRDDLRCVLLSPGEDPDGDKLQYHFSWSVQISKKSKRQKAQNQALLPATLTRKGQRWLCSVQADDGQQKSKAVSARVKIYNTAPSAPELQLEPRQPVAGVDSLRCVLHRESQDPDGDKLRYQVRWFKDAVAQKFASSNMEVPARLVTAHSLWQCAVTASDGAASSPTAQSQSVLVHSSSGAKE